MSETREIRFIDPNYNELFRVPDGGYISVTRPDGEQYFHPCGYIDETHCEIGGNVYHICQFAEIQARNGAIVEPLRKPEIVNGYRVYERITVGKTVFSAAINPKAQPDKRCVTWQMRNDRLINGETRYFPGKSEAWADLLRRADGERRGVPYTPAPAEKKQRDRGAR